MTDNVTPLVLTETDEADLARLHSEPDGIEPPSFHTVLEVWREVLKPAAEEMKTQVTPTWAHRVVTSYPEIAFADLKEFQTRYFTKILELANILNHEINEDPECLGYANVEEDSKHNGHHYKNILLNWQLQFLEWELEWDCIDEWAAVEFAAMSEVHKMFFGEQSITAYLESIRFEFTEDDQQLVAEALLGLRGDRE